MPGSSSVTYRRLRAIATTMIGRTQNRVRSGGPEPAAESMERVAEDPRDVDLADADLVRDLRLGAAPEEPQIDDPALSLRQLPDQLPKRQPRFRASQRRVDLAEHEPFGPFGVVLVGRRPE